MQQRAVTPLTGFSFVIFLVIMESARALCTFWEALRVEENQKDRGREDTERKGKKGKGKRARRAWNESEQGKTQSKIGEVE